MEATAQVAIVGGGAAGFFMAANLAAMRPDMQISILERTPKLLSKVLVSGGGRCNVTNNCMDIRALAGFYPRGGKHLRKVFGKFAVADTIEWFESRGVKLKAEPDNRMFPVTDKSQTIADCLLKACDKPNISIRTQAHVQAISKVANGFELTVNGSVLKADVVFLACGGFHKKEGYQWLTDMGLSIVPPVPSLFTFNLPNDDIKAMPGLSVPNAQVRIAGTKLLQQGPVLVTHWGLSGPAVLKLSAWGARELHYVDYNYEVAISWTGEKDQELMRQQLLKLKNDQSKKTVFKTTWPDLPRRLWEHLCRKAEINEQLVWGELPKKNLNKLILLLCDDRFAAQGKTTYKEEFVTSGGVDMAEVDMNTMQARNTEGLYFGGEVLNVDGVTGGFNFQAAWSTAWLAAKSIAAIK